MKAKHVASIPKPHKKYVPPKKIFFHVTQSSAKKNFVVKNVDVDLVQADYSVVVVPSSKPSKGIIISENVANCDVANSEKVVVLVGESDDVGYVEKAPMNAGTKDKGKGKLLIAFPNMDVYSCDEDSRWLTSMLPPSLEAKE